MIAQLEKVEKEKSEIQKMKSEIETMVSTQRVFERKPLSELEPLLNIQVNILSCH